MNGKRPTDLSDEEARAISIAAVQRGCAAYRAILPDEEAAIASPARERRAWRAMRAEMNRQLTARPESAVDRPAAPQLRRASGSMPTP